MNALGISIAAAIGLLFVSIFIDRVLNPFLWRKEAKKLLAGGKNADPRMLENPKYGSVTGDTDCLRINSDKGNASELRWSEIEEVHAFKEDLFTTDLICLAFKRAGEDEYHRIHEEMAGYHDLLEVLPSRLPKFSMTWMLSVPFPAFKTNHQVIWRRGPEAKAS